MTDGTRQTFDEAAAQWRCEHPGASALPAMPPVEVSVRFSAESYLWFKALAEETGQPAGLVLAKALLLYRETYDAVKGGKRVGIATAAGELETDFVGV